jgi:hypothetical protein
MKRSQKWRGDLARRLRHRRIGPLASPELRAAAAQAEAKELLSKLELLLDHYGIPGSDPQSWLRLSLELAKECDIPGFKPEARLGAPKKWGMFERAILVVEIDRLRSSQRLSIASAAKALAKQEPWRTGISQWSEEKSLGADPGEVLRRKYVQAKSDKWAKVAKEVFYGHEATKNLGQWARLVHSCFRPPKEKGT